MAPISRPAKKRSGRSWEALGLPEWCLEAVGSMGFTEPTPSQAAAIPLFLANSDVVVEAPTGSGKSLAFLLPLATRLLRRFGPDGAATPIKRGHVAAVVLAPTRELADQLHRVLTLLLAFHPPTAAILPYTERSRAGDAAEGDSRGGKKGKKDQAAKGASSRKRAAAAAAAAAATTFMAANGQQIVGDVPDEATAPLASSRRPETLEAVLVPQLVVGGTASKPADDVARFVRQGSNVLVGTPGRLAELLSSRLVNATASFEALVLDEADRLLDLGFSADLQRILAFVPKQRRTFLCSASVNDAIGELIKVNLRNPKRVVVRVQTRKAAVPSLQDDLSASASAAAAAPESGGAMIDEKKTPASLINTFVSLPSSHKLPVLLQLLEHIEPRPLRTLVFFASCFSVKYFAAVLPAALPAGYTIVSLHGKLEPHVREKAFARFLSATSPCVLLTTDVASRGLDVPHADLVVNIDPPTDPKTFLHRCGRTGRAGRRGLAVTMLRPGRETDDYVPFLAVRKTPVEPLATCAAVSDNLAEHLSPFVQQAAGQAAGQAAAANATSQAAALTATIQRQVLQDRDLHLLGQRAFVSWARAFQEHRATSIFRAADLDWHDLGRAWGLACLPKMPELRAVGITNRSLASDPDDDDIDVYAIPFRDAAKEKKRQSELAAAAAARASGASAELAAAHAATRKRNAPWSARQDRDTERGERRDKRRRKRLAERMAQMTPEERQEALETEALVAQVRLRNQAAEAEAAKARAVKMARDKAEADDDEEFGGFAD